MTNDFSFWTFIPIKVKEMDLKWIWVNLLTNFIIELTSIFLISET